MFATRLTLFAWQ